MHIKKMHWMGGIFAFILLLVDVVFFRGDSIFFFLVGISLTILLLPVLITLILEGKKEQEINEQFLEFTRNLAESVKTGTPISKSIVNMKERGYGNLSPYVQKLANQISLGVPVSKALQNFADDVNSIVIKRAITLIREAENAGGEIDHILESVSHSIYEVEKLKKERKSAVSSLVVQGYIIFFVFLGIMLVMQFKILPLVSEVGDVNTLGATNDFGALGESGAIVGGNAATAEELARPLLYLLIVQGLFAGLIIGKLSEGTIKSGIKHSIILLIISLLVSSGAGLFLSV